MKIILLLTIVVGLAYGEEDSCPEFDSSRDFSDCLWWPLSKMRDDSVKACGLDMPDEIKNLPDPPIPEGFNIPEKCGRCSFKLKCLTREPSEGCFPLKGEVEQCEEHDSICELPKMELGGIGCDYHLLSNGLKQCLARPEIPDWKRTSMSSFHDILPNLNCAEKDGKCFCCCHPTEPDENKEKCVEVKPEHTGDNCPAFGEFNEWSDCMFFPVKDLISGIQGHCDIKYKPTGDSAKLSIPTPPGFEIPNKCGMCSFKVRCKKRDPSPGCFPVAMEKVACGENDCPDCHKPCELAKLGGDEGSCDWNKAAHGIIKGKLAFLKNAPYWRRKGMWAMISNMPHGRCIEVDGKCKCCCHPYMPSADGTKCEVKGYCKLPSDFDIIWKGVNAPRD